MKRISLPAIFLIAFLSACGTRSGSNTTNAVAEVPAEAITAMEAEKQAADGRQPLTNADQGNGQPLTPTKISLNKAEETYSAGRKIIRNAELNLEAESPEEAQRKITAIAEKHGGFVVESQQSSSDVKSTTRDIATMSVRIPANKFSDALADIRDTATRIVEETVKGQDVTEEFIDIEAQVTAKKALEQQFMEIMRRTTSVAEALDVQRQLAGVRGEIERIEGRKRFLENQSSMSTIKVRLQTPKVFAASTIGVTDRLYGSFAAGADVALNFVLGLLTFVVAALPFALFVVLPVFLVLRYLWKRYAHGGTLIELADEELKRT